MARHLATTQVHKHHILKEMIDALRNKCGSGHLARPCCTARFILHVEMLGNNKKIVALKKKADNATTDENRVNQQWRESILLACFHCGEKKTRKKISPLESLCSAGDIRASSARLDCGRYIVMESTNLSLYGIFLCCLVENGIPRF